eukprot:3787578-Rhodomonas_salina.1
MEACRLEDRVPEALAWLEDKGCDSVVELCAVAMEKEFVDVLQLKDIKAKLLLQKLQKWSPGQ